MKCYWQVATYLIFFFVSHFGLGQDLTSSKWGSGLKVTAQDSSFHLKFGFRFQTLYVGELNTVTDEYSDKMLIRRSRLKFDGWAYDPSIVYKVELAISNRDQRSGHIQESGNTANIVLDAAIKWSFSKDWQLWFGQTKLPGNRERVISSQKLQFVDRSLVNSRFTLDRDKGIQIRHKNKAGGMVINQAFAFSLGEGRNIIADNPRGGYQLTGRLEFLPFGSFTNKGDYFGSDLEREESPKLSVGITGDANFSSVRSRGNLGGFNTDVNGNYLSNDLTTIIADMMFKFNGISASSEFATRSKGRSNTGFGTGSGFVFQAGYLLPSNWEFAGRYTTINGDSNSTISDLSEMTFGISRYIVGHSLKVQSDFSYQDIPSGDNGFVFRLQTEIAL
ncbi:MAG: porin [Cyclobacteriaceae bacterium]